MYISNTEVRARVHNKDPHFDITSSRNNAHAEHWEPIAGYEGLYEVSCLGSIRSLPRLRRNSRGQGFNLSPGRTLKPTRRFRGDYDYGHLKVTLCREGQKKTVDVAVLVARAFLGEPGPGQQVRHGPAGTSDNSVQNLSYGTAKQNTDDRKRDGTYPIGEKNSRRRLTDEAVRDIRRRYAQGELQRQIAASFGVSRPVISQIVRRKTWRHIP